MDDKGFEHEPENENESSNFPEKKHGNELTFGGNVTNSNVVAGNYNTINIYSQDKQAQIFSWQEIKSACFENTSEAFESMKGKYIKELYVDRASQKELINQFIVEDKTRFFILNGRSGMGKSGLLFNIVTELNEKDSTACIVYDCSRKEITRNHSILTPVDHLFKMGDVGEILEAISNARKNDHQRLVLVLDAINENKELEEIVKRLDSLGSGKRYPWIKVLISCRPHIYRRLKDLMIGEYRIPVNLFFTPQSCSRRLGIDLPEFTDKELRDAYEKHQAYYKFMPENFDELSAEVRRQLKEPLMLRLMAEIYQGCKDINERGGYTDLSIIPKYVNFLLGENIGVVETRDAIWDGEDVLKIIVPGLMIRDNTCHNVVELDSIYTAIDSLNESVQNKENKKIIVRDVFLRHGILEKIDEKEVHFRYERFYDYYFGFQLINQVRKTEDLNCQPTQASI